MTSSAYTAQTYSIDTILQMKKAYTEAPYPGFNLFDICRKKSAAGVQRLTKGEHAWVATKPKTSDEVLIKTVRGLLNKLTPEKYDDVYAEADLGMLLEAESIELVVELIFEKALLEPAYSKTYSRFCHDVSMYEVNLSPCAAEGTGPKSRRSEFRNKIVSRAQREFERKEEMKEELTKQQVDLANAAQAKRKRANIKFVGQLYLQRVISVKTMHMIIRGIFSTDDKKPKEIDVEVLTELLETIGKTIDESSMEGRAAMDDHFDELDDLLRRVDKREVKVGPRIRFRIMDTLELRENAWVPRVHNKSNITPATFSDQQRAVNTPLGNTPGGLGMRSPTTSSTPNRRTPATPGSGRFPDAPSQTPTKNAWRGDVPSSVNAHSNPSTPSSSVQVAARTPIEGAPKTNSSNNTNTTSSTAWTANVTTKPSEKLIDRIQAGRREWKDNNQQLDFGSYISTLCGYPGVSEDTVRNVVAHEVVKEACTTSRADAQDEACKFLVAGVGIGKGPLLTAFSRVIQQAIEDDTAGDVPLFYSRIVKIVTQCCGSEETIDVYRDTIIATFFAFDQLNAAAQQASNGTSPNLSPTGANPTSGFPTRSASALSGVTTGAQESLEILEDYIEELLKVWRLLPQTGLDAAKVVSSVFESRGADNSTVGLVVAVLDHLINAAGIATVEEVKKWTESSKADGAPDLKKALTEKFSL